MLSCQIVEMEAKPYINTEGELEKKGCELALRVLFSNNPRLAVRVHQLDLVKKISNKIHKVSKKIKVEKIEDENYYFLSLEAFGGKEKQVWMNINDLVGRFRLTHQEIQVYSTLDTLMEFLRVKAIEIVRYYELYDEILKITQFESKSVISLLTQVQKNSDVPFGFYMPSVSVPGTTAKRKSGSGTALTEKQSNHSLIGQFLGPHLDGSNTKDDWWQLNLYSIKWNEVKHCLFNIENTFKNKFKEDSEVLSNHEHYSLKECLFEYEDGTFLYKTSPMPFPRIPLCRDPWLCGITNSLKKAETINNFGGCRGIITLLTPIHAYNIHGEDIGAIGYLTPTFSETLENFKASPEHRCSPIVGYSMIDQLLSAVTFLHQHQIFHVYLELESVSFTHVKGTSDYHFVIRNLDHAFYLNELVAQYAKIQELQSWACLLDDEKVKLKEVTWTKEKTSSADVMVNQWSKFVIGRLGYLLSSVINSKMGKNGEKSLFDKLLASMSNSNHSERISPERAREELDRLFNGYIKPKQT